jgi:hypothetical protein
MADGRDCFIHLADKEGESLTSALYTTSKGFVEAQKHLFETLWNKATTAQERIKDIEEGLKPGFIQSFEDRYEVQKKALDLIGSAKQEILGIFSSINTDSNLLSRLKEEDNKEKQQQEQLPRQEHDGIQLLKQAAIRGVSIRIIARNENAFIKELKQQVLPREQQSQQNKIQIQFFQPNFQKVPITLIIDRKESLLVELIDEQKPNEPFSKSMEMSRATYSNNEYTVSSYISIFETLWMQNELSTIPGDIAKAQ